MTVRYAHACISMDLGINGDDPFLFQNIRNISSLNVLPEIKSNALEREQKMTILVLLSYVVW